MYDIRPPPPDREAITIGDRRRLKVEYIGSMDTEFHGYIDQRISLTDVLYIPGLGLVCIQSTQHPGLTWYCSIL